MLVPAALPLARRGPAAALLPWARQLLRRVLWLGLGRSLAAVLGAVWALQVALSALGSPPGPPPFPLLGTLPYIALAGITNLNLLVLKHVKQYGPVVRGWLAFRTTYSTSDGGIMYRMLVSRFRRYDRARLEQCVFQEFLGDGLILIGNQKWHCHRKLFDAAFTSNNLDIFVRGVMRRQVDAYVGSLASLAAGGSWVEVQQLTQAFTFRVASSFVLGVDTGEMPQPAGGWALAWHHLLEEQQFRAAFVGMLPWWKVIKTRSVLRTEATMASLEELVDQATERLKAPGNSKEDGFVNLLSLMLEAGYSRESIQKHVLTFLFAGHDTTASLLTFALGYLADHPEWQQRVAEEAADPEGAGSATSAVLRETLRLQPPVPLRGRTVAEGDEWTWKDRKGVDRRVQIPRGADTGFGIQALHRDPAVWPEPDAFDPGRFLRDDEVTRQASSSSVSKSPSITRTCSGASSTSFTKTYSGAVTNPLRFAPFGAGPRRCIGERLALAEASEALAAVVGRFRLEPHPEHRPHAEMAITLRARDPGVLLRLTPR